jgi:hypothetical protein
MKRTILALLIGTFAAAQSQAADNSQVLQACHQALQHFCSGKTGQDAVSCLKSNSEKLPQRCKDALPADPRASK